MKVSFDGLDTIHLALTHFLQKSVYIYILPIQKDCSFVDYLINGTIEDGMSVDYQSYANGFGFTTSKPLHQREKVRRDPLHIWICFLTVIYGIDHVYFSDAEETFNNGSYI